MHFHLNTTSLRGGLRPTWQSVPFCQTLFGVGGRIRLHLLPQGANYGVAAIELAASNSPPDYCIYFFESVHNDKKTECKSIRSFCGGGGRIRTIEAKRSRFTVCPLWPLGNSPIFNSCLNGAGRRTRTPDLLITNQLLYQLSYTGGSNRTFIL